MSRIVKTTDASYKVAVASGGVITLDTGDHLGSVDITNDLNVVGNITGTWAGDTIDVARGGTGASSIPLGAVVVGNGTSSISTISPGVAGTVLTSDGSAWVSQDPPLPSLTDDNSSNTVQYISMVRNTSGFQESVYVSSNQLYFNPSTGSLTVTEVNTFSDLTLKTNVEPLANSIEIIRQLNPVKFNWKTNNKIGYGVIAQEIEKIIPDIVQESGNIKSVSYMQIIAFLIDSIKQQDLDIQLLKSKINL